MSKNTILLRSRLRKAQELVNSSQFNKALTLLEKLANSAQHDPQVFAMLGFVSAKSGHQKTAADYYRKALSLRPDNAQLLFNLGHILFETGEHSDAISALKKALNQQPSHRDAANTLAHIFIARGQFTDAENVLRTAIRMHPRDAELHSNLGAVLKNSGYVDQAAEYFQKALAINPQLPAYANYAATLSDQGRFNESIATYREGLRRHPLDPAGYSNMLLTLNYIADSRPDSVFKEHRGWIKTLGNHVPRTTQHSNARDAKKKLRIGYVSSDFRTHSVANYIEPILAAHSRENVAVYCYASVPRPDETTRRLKSLSDYWRNTTTLNPHQLAEQVLSDHIDILVDLAGHTAHNRLPVFALKPAPVQVTYLGYPNTTGLDTIDYRLTDDIADPPGEEEFYTEQLIRLPGCFLCYQPPITAPEVAILPAETAGYITFGSFNNLSKINNDVISLWGKILRSVPNSLMLLKNPALTDPARRSHYQALFKNHGIEPDRIKLRGHTPTREEHLGTYAEVDIALDTFPYNGTTTTCEALYMGVPVITLSGKSHRNRVGASLLESIDKTQWVAKSQDDYVSIATSLASNVQELADIRHQLRTQLLASDLCNAENFTENLELAYRNMWHNWCHTLIDKSSHRP